MARWVVFNAKMYYEDSLEAAKRMGIDNLAQFMETQAVFHPITVDLDKVILYGEVFSKDTGEPTGECELTFISGDSFITDMPFKKLDKLMRNP